MKKISVLLFFVFVLCFGKTSNASVKHVAAGSVKSIVQAAETFIGSLTTAQRELAVLPYNQTNATKWTNLPCGAACRVGILFSALDEGQLAKAKAVIKAAMGTASGLGYDQVMQIVATDDVLALSMSGYSSGNYLISFLGTPSTTGIWQLQLGGHHMALNLTFKAGEVVGNTPFFIGLEPPSRTSGAVTYAPLKANQSGMAAMLASLSATELASAKLTRRFGDVSVGPGADGKFPATKQGLKCSELSKEQKALVLAAMQPWVNNIDEVTAKKIMAAYANEIDNTYIAYSGNPGLSAVSDYVRIDGPGVWIEFICQAGAVYRNGIHYHSIYRDHVRDYGGNFTF